MEAASVGRSLVVTPPVWTHGVHMSPLVLLLSTRCVLQVATTPPVAWTAPFSPWLSLSLSRSSSSPRLHRRYGELGSPCRGVSSRAAPPNASPESPYHRRRVGCSCRASVSPHCLLRRELTSSEFRHGHWGHGLGSLVEHFFSFLFQKLRLVMLMLVGVLFCPFPTRDAGGWPHTTTVPPIARARSLGCGRVRVFGTNRRGGEWGARWCPWPSPRPRHRWDFRRSSLASVLRVTDGWGPLTCGVSLSVPLSSCLNLRFVLFLEKS